MDSVKIANILLENSRQFHTVPLLYIHTNGGTCIAKDDAWLMSGPATFDFTTFFNGLTVYKYDKYTIAKGYRLHLELKGSASVVRQTCVDALDYYSRPQEDSAITVANSNEWQSIDLDISYQPSDIIVGFTIETKGTVEIRNSYYCALVDGDKIRNVELALSTTTFKKESFIKHNINLIRKNILDSDDSISKHFRMYVVDNGRTLDAAALSGNGMTIFPNENVGGSGGFTYGMIKALEAGDVTNILLMDDDVEVSPESIRRTYRLLTIVNDEYKDAFVSGAMMNFDEPDVHWEDIGYMTAAGVYRPVKPVYRMSSLHDCVACEAFNLEIDLWKDLKQRYAAWWYCCIPLSIIKQNGLPLPFFVRFDDAEYGMRCKPKFMAINGICIWHLAFLMRYNAAVERYQTTRNGLIGQAITEVAPLTDFMIEIKRNMMLELVKFNYTDAELLCEGFEDFLKGPEYFSQKGMAEKRFMDANKNKEKLLPLEELKKAAKDQLGKNLDKIDADGIRGDFPLGFTPHGKIYNVYHTQLFERSLNGQLFGQLEPFNGDTAIVEAVGWSYQPGRLYGVKHVIAINIQAKKGVIRHRDNKRAQQIWHRFKNDIETYERQKSQIEASYHSIRQRITSIEFWKDYLNI
jgi:GT2 family glycosyltransferase